MERRVVVTGLGVVTPLGWDLGEFWSNLVEGRSGIGPVTTFDTSDARCRIAGEIHGFDPKPFFNNNRDAKRADRYIGFSMAASKLAVSHAGLDLTRVDLDRGGVILGTGIGGLHAIEDGYDILVTKGPGKISAFALPMMIANAAGGLVAMDLGLTGPNYCVTSACATGSHAIGEAWKSILFNDADFFLAGGSESVITRLAYAGFGNMRALSCRNDDPAGACRPFDAERDGFVMSEGAGVVLLEELQHARARGAEILCELVGYGASADAFHPTMPHPEGRGASQCMDRALQRARLEPRAVQYINAHGTSTPQGDVAETLAIKRTFGDHARNGLQISSTKSMTGHLLGAAGGVELAIAALVIRHGVIPPTINLCNPDPECDLDYVPNAAREGRIDVALSNSFGFGGNNAALVLRRFER